MTVIRSEVGSDADVLDAKTAAESLRAAAYSLGRDAEHFKAGSEGVSPEQREGVRELIAGLAAMVPSRELAREDV